VTLQRKVAVAQTSPVPGDTAATVVKLVEWAGKAASDGARLIVFPEAFIGGYPKGVSFGIAVGKKTPEGREEFRQYFDSAIDVPGSETQLIAEAAGHLNVHIVVGVIERDGGTLYCTALFFSPGGTLLGKHRKLMPTAGERYIWGFGDGSTLPVFDSELGKIGAVICWENYMPMLRMAMYAKGIQIYCAPTADDRPYWIPSMQHIAVEGRCFVLSACQYLRRNELPSNLCNAITDDPDVVLMRGGSVIIDPFGKILAGPVFDDNAILYAELDLAEISRGKFDLDVVGHYSRPDVFQLSVNEVPLAAVMTK